MCDENEENDAPALASAEALALALAAMKKELQESQKQCGEINGKNSTLQRENDALQHENDALNRKIIERVTGISPVLGILSTLVLLAMMNIIPQALMSIVISSVAGLLVKMHDNIGINYNQGRVFDMIVMSTCTFVCVVASSALGVLLPFLGSCAFGGCVAYATYMFMTI